MPDTTEIQGFDATATIIVAILLAVFGIIVGFQLGTQLARNTKTRKEYLQKCAIAYGFAILFTAVVCMTGYLVLSVLMFGAIGGLIAGLTMEYGNMIGPFKAAHDFVGKKRKNSQDSAEQTHEHPLDSADKEQREPQDVPNMKRKKAQDEANKKRPQKNKKEEIS